MLLAVSGGVDSTALLLGFSDLRNEGITVAAAHVNHHLRGADSDADEAFVRALCEQLGLALHVADGTLDDDALRDRGIEAAAREVRYRRLLELRDRIGADFVATAHQKNDQAETVLMRLLTGSGLSGLRGIHPIREDRVIRPLLDVTRAEIEAFLRERGVTPRFDRSNDDPRFVRNRVRVLIQQLGPELGVVNHLAAVADQAREQWPILEQAIDDAESQHAEIHDDETRFTSWPDDPWLRAALLRRHIRRLDPDARDFNADRLAAELPALRRTTVTKDLELKPEGHAYILRRKPQPTVPFELPVAENEPAEITTLQTTIHVQRTPHPRQPATSNQQQERQPTTDNRQRFQLPAEATGKFKVRNRRPGDRFQPLGLPFPKKLKDFLIDRKIPEEIRDRFPLLVWNDEIVWVAGVEISERFKVTASGGTVYEAWLHPERGVRMPNPPEPTPETSDPQSSIPHPQSSPSSDPQSSILDPQSGMSAPQQVFSAEEISRRVAEIGGAIRRQTGDGEVFLLCILKGASLFLADLLRTITGDVSYGFIDVVRDAGDNQTADALEIDFLSFTDIRGRNVYVLKDVVNTGVIENYLLTQLRTHSPAALRLVALLDRPDGRTVDIQTDFSAFSIREGTYAGYGLEHARRFANLPFIGRVDLQ